MRTFLAAIVALGLFAPSVTDAQEVKFRVRVLLASKQGNRIDPQIDASVRKYLERSFGARYSSFRQLDNRVLKVKLDTTGEVALPDQTSLRLKFRDVQGEFVKLTMEIKDLRTTIRIRDGGLFFQAGHRYKNGMLILAISATVLGKKGGGEKEKLTTPRPEPRTTPEEPAGKPRSIEK